MPYAIRSQHGKVEVVTKTTGSVHGTFPDSPEGRKHAEAQMRALYANAPPGGEKKTDGAARVRRFDRGEMRKAEKTVEGFLRAPASIARTGIYLYVDGEGKITRELRRPESVGDPESLASFALAPVTDGHPVEGYVDATTAKKYARGSIGETVTLGADGSVDALMMVTDADLVKKVLDGGAAECSCGYTCEIDPTPGEWNGQAYDTEQTKIRGNHVAIVPAGRAGPAQRVKLDAGDAIALRDEGHGERNDKERSMEKEIMINGQTFKLPAHVVDAINAQRASDEATVRTKIDAFDADGKVKADALAAQTARADAAVAEVATLKKAATDAAAAQPKLVADALEVVDVARRAGCEVKIDALDLPALRREVAEKVNGVKLDGKSDAYVAASFDIAKAKIDESPTGALALAALHKGEERLEREDADDSAEAARAKMAKRNADAWKPVKK